MGFAFEEAGRGGDLAFEQRLCSAVRQEERTVKVGVIGLGLMGLSIAKNLAKAGFVTTVYDVRPDAAAGVSGLHPAAGPSEVGTAADVVFLSLPGPAEVEAVCMGQHGLVARMAKGGVIVDLSTNSIRTVRAIEAMAKQAGIDFLDAPVSGGPWGAADGTLAIWVGGAEEAFTRALPAISAIGTRISYMGGIGTGTVTKLVHNTAANIRTGMLAEVMNLGVKGGIDPAALWSAIRDGSHGRQRTFDSLGGKILDGTYDAPAFKLRHARKDVVVALELGEELGVPLPLARQALETLDAAMERGWGDRDSNIQVKIIQERAGLDIPPVDATTLKAIAARD
jgi:3-hydroxyisobutyrate dehydrogenase